MINLFSSGNNNPAPKPEETPVAVSTENNLTKIFVVEDNDLYSQLILNELSVNDTYEVTIYPTAEALLKDLYKNPNIVTIDYNLPDGNGIEVMKQIQTYNRDIECVILSGQDKVEVVVECYKAGAASYIIKNNNTFVELGVAVYKVAEKIKQRGQVSKLQEQIIDRHRYDKIIGESAAILRVLRLIQKVEKTSMLALITGESGTGKEVVSSAIHFNSNRARKPYVPVNMAAIPADLMESELFGHEKGAFTGADSKRIGKFEEANEGTIFLDEIGEMDMNLQTKLLRVLQENKITRLGSNKETQLNVRIIAATNKNLSTRVKEGKMREDLYYRLQGFLIHLPPLRERGDDILLLSKFFLKGFCERNGMAQKTFSADAYKAMQNHPWPGNVRELKALVERAAIISDTNVISSDDMIFSQEI
ncbi:MAG: sigma-54 dependent transcriptional regulator [Bacteroidota bacterium]